MQTHKLSSSIENLGDQNQEQTLFPSHLIVVEEVLILIDHILQPTAKITTKIIKRIPIIIEIMTCISNINNNSIKGNKIFKPHRMIHLMKIMQRRISILVLDKLQNFLLIKINSKTNQIMLNLRIVLLQDKVQMIILSKI